MSSQATPLGKPSPHDSAVLHVTGRAHYVDDRPHQRGQLVAFIVGSPMAHGELIELSVDAALETPGVHAILTHQDIPGINDASPRTRRRATCQQDCHIQRTTGCSHSW